MALARPASPTLMLSAGTVAPARRHTSFRIIISFFGLFSKIWREIGALNSEDVCELLQHWTCTVGYQSVSRHNMSSLGTFDQICTTYLLSDILYSISVTFHSTETPMNRIEQQVASRSSKYQYSCCDFEEQTRLCRHERSTFKSLIRTSYVNCQLAIVCGWFRLPWWQCTSTLWATLGRRAANRRGHSNRRGGVIGQPLS
jgi:hypothetical protein